MISLINRRKCNICNANVFMIIEKQNYHLYNYEYAICKNCGHVYQRSDYGDEHYINLPYQTQYDDYLGHSKRRSEYILDFYSKGNGYKEKIDLNECEVLDIGCGKGGVLFWLKQKFPNAKLTGITPDKIDLKTFFKEHSSEKKLPIKIIAEEVKDLSCEDKYDLIMMSHVLEHLPNPIEDLKNVRKSLKPDGFLYIEVPSFLWVDSKLKNVFTPEHISYFHKDLLSGFLESLGFEIVLIEESKKWRNIKVLLKKSNVFKASIETNYQKILFLYRIRKILHIYYKVVTNFKRLQR